MIGGLQNSKSQLGQDLFVLETLKYKTNGFFVEFGAMDGIYCSNSYLLEKDYGWKGICAEPNNVLYEQLVKNRSCKTANVCIGAEEKEVELLITQDPSFSCIQEYRASDYNVNQRLSGSVQIASMITLASLLKDTEQEIDYMSVDTEGTELELLQKFFLVENNKKHFPKILTVEHNFTEPTRREICSLLSTFDFVRVLTEKSRWDDWFVQSYLL